MASIGLTISVVTIVLFGLFMAGLAFMMLCGLLSPIASDQPGEKMSETPALEPTAPPVTAHRMDYWV